MSTSNPRITVQSNQLTEIKQQAYILSGLIQPYCQGTSITTNQKLKHIAILFGYQSFESLCNESIPTTDTDETPAIFCTKVKNRARHFISSIDIDLKITPTKRLLDKFETSIKTRFNNSITIEFLKKHEHALQRVFVNDQNETCLYYENDYEIQGIDDLKYGSDDYIGKDSFCFTNLLTCRGYTGSGTNVSLRFTEQLHKSIDVKTPYQNLYQVRKALKTIIDPYLESKLYGNSNT